MGKDQPNTPPDSGGCTQDLGIARFVLGGLIMITLLVTVALFIETAPEAVCRGHMEYVSAVAVSPDSQLII
jgi:hypothetical protein